MKFSERYGYVKPAEALKGSGDRYLNHLYTIKKWNVLQERIQEILYRSYGASRYQADLYASTTERIKRQSQITKVVFSHQAES